jgi:hypothetical protein
MSDLYTVTVPTAPTAVVSPSGGLALRTNGGPGRTLYVNESGSTSAGTSGWNPTLTASLTDNITAAGTTQETATALTARNNIVTSVPALGVGVILSGTSGPQEQEVFNFGGNALTVYPPAGAAIDGGSVNAPITVAVGAHYRFLVRSLIDIRSNN